MLPTNAEFSASCGADAVVLSGEIDLATAPGLRSALEGARQSGLARVDLTDVAYIDSAGIAVLYEYAGLEFIVRDASIVARVLEIAGLPSVTSLKR